SSSPGCRRRLVWRPHWPRQRRSLRSARVHSSRACRRLTSPRRLRPPGRAESLDGQSLPWTKTLLIPQYAARIIRWPSQNMIRSDGRIRVTHQGTLPRPDDLRALVRARADGTAVDQAELSERIRAAVGDVVRKQVEIGVDSINDGEQSKTTFSD